MNAKDVAFLLVKRQTPFNLRRNLCCVSNVSWGFGLDWEADLICVTKSKFMHEIEIKISMNDWAADAKKSKFVNTKGWDRFKFFWYAAPIELAKRFPEVWTKDGSGIIGVSDEKIEILRKAEQNKMARKVTDSEVMTLMRLGCMKAFK